jgi:hypothetical protein
MSFDGSGEKAESNTCLLSASLDDGEPRFWFILWPLPTGWSQTAHLPPARRRERQAAMTTTGAAVTTDRYEVIDSLTM